MEFKELFKVGDLIKINLSKDEVFFYNTKILVIDLEKSFFVVSSIEKDLPLGSIISGKKEFKDLFFVFNTKVLGFAHGEHKNILVLKIPKEMHRIQKREFYRLPLNVEIRIRDSRNNICMGKSQNISGTGICVETNSILMLEENIKIRIPFSNDMVLEGVDGIIKNVETGKYFSYRYGITFNNIDEDSKEKIVAYIFKAQKILLQISHNM